MQNIDTYQKLFSPLLTLLYLRKIMLAISDLSTNSRQKYVETIE